MADVQIIKLGSGLDFCGNVWQVTGTGNLQRVLGYVTINLIRDSLFI
jgi:hypothetical protein